MADFRVEYGNVSFGIGGGGTQTVTPSEAIDTTRGFPWNSCARAGSSGRNVVNTANLNNDDLTARIRNYLGTSFDIERVTGSESANHRHYWQTLEDRTPDHAKAVHGWTMLETSAKILGTDRQNAGVQSSTTAVVSGITDIDRCVVWPVSSQNTFTLRRFAAVHAMRRMLNPGGEIRVFRGNSTGINQTSWAVMQMGSAWEVETVLASTTTRGSVVTFTGAGSRPWANKFLIATYAVPSGASNLASNPIFFAGLNPDEIRFHVDPSAGAGTYWMNAYVCYHPLLQVEHQNTIDGDFDTGSGDIDGGTETISTTIPNGVSDPSAITLISYMGGTGTGTLYPVFHYGYELDGTDIRWRHGRTAARFSQGTYQAVRWFNAPGALGNYRGVSATASSAGVSGWPRGLGISGAPSGTGVGRSIGSRGVTTAPGGR